jgi:hypothetical protein
MSARQLKEPQRLIRANTAIYLPSFAQVSCLSMEVNRREKEGEEVHF